MRLVDDVAEQQILEEILERSKPAIPAAAQRLHYLLSTPFRYSAPYGSRFRAADDPGVFYGAEVQRTACAELGYWRWRFFTDSANLRRLDRLGPVAHTVFHAEIGTMGVDLRELPFVRDTAHWSHPSDYSATQAFAKVARKAGVGAIRYESVRDPEHGACVAVLRPDAFTSARPAQLQTWFLTVTQHVITWQRDGDYFEFHAKRGR
jgi:hypothetical protein